MEVEVEEVVMEEVEVEMVLVEASGRVRVSRGLACGR
jgi:hypothetical protein